MLKLSTSGPFWEMKRERGEEENWTKVPRQDGIKGKREKEDDEERERRYKRINKNRELNRKSFKSCKRNVW